eukprot:SAG25_NODE_5323_length_672_cov_1.734729_1_plen_127_part_10
MGLSATQALRLTLPFCRPSVGTVRQSSVSTPALLLSRCRTGPATPITGVVHPPVVRGSSFRAHTNCNVWFGGAVGLSEGVQLAQQRDMNARAEDAIDANVGESQSLLVMHAFISHLLTSPPGCLLLA